MSTGSSKVILDVSDPTIGRVMTVVVTVKSSDNVAPSDAELQIVREHFPSVLRSGHAVGGPWDGEPVEEGDPHRITAFFNLESGDLPDHETLYRAADQLEKKLKPKKNKRGPVSPKNDPKKGLLGGKKGKTK